MFIIILVGKGCSDDDPTPAKGRVQLIMPFVLYMCLCTYIHCSPCISFIPMYTLLMYIYICNECTLVSIIASARTSCCHLEPTTNKLCRLHVQTHQSI